MNPYSSNKKKPENEGLKINAIDLEIKRVYQMHLEDWKILSD